MSSSIPNHISNAIQTVASAENLSVTQDDIQALSKGSSTEVVIQAGKPMDADIARNLLSKELGDESVVREKGRSSIDGSDGGEELVLEVFVS